LLVGESFSWIILKTILGLVLDFLGIYINPIEFTRHDYIWVCRGVPSSALTTPRELCYCLRNLAVAVSVVPALPFAMGSHLQGHLENMGKKQLQKERQQTNTKNIQANHKPKKISKLKNSYCRD